MRALRPMTWSPRRIADAHTTALAEAMEYLAAHAGYTRVHNPITGQKDLVRLPGLVAVAYQHETRGAGIRTCTPTSSCPTASPRRRRAGVDGRDVAVSRSQGGRG